MERWSYDGAPVTARFDIVAGRTAQMQSLSLDLERHVGGERVGLELLDFMKFGQGTGNLYNTHIKTCILLVETLQEVLTPRKRPRDASFE
ncbi:hypothetical protein V6N11_006806 [Hibiscus sabdariffa]|uniref:Uncharacterized protein n=1 Tax=Hibiscus sabdariffa TaxID=183260 RepID=A0ABR2RSN1_9ROSI